MYGRSCAAALSYVSTCNARQVCSACREQERIKALPKKSVQLNTPRPHKTRSELNSESSLRRRPNRECRHERRSPPGARPSAPPRRQARPGRRALADGGPRPPRRGRRSRELGATHPRADGPVHPELPPPAPCWSPCRARLTFVPRTPRRAVSGLREKR